MIQLRFQLTQLIQPLLAPKIARPNSGSSLSRGARSLVREREESCGGKRFSLSRAGARHGRTSEESGEYLNICDCPRFEWNGPPAEQELQRPSAESSRRTIDDSRARSANLILRKLVPCRRLAKPRPNVCVSSAEVVEGFREI